MKPVLWIVSLCLLAIFPIQAGAAVQGTSSALKNDASSGFLQSIQLKEQLSREKQDWARLQSMLETEIEYLERQIQENQRRVGDLQREQTEALEKRRELLRKKEREEQWLSQALDLRVQLAGKAELLKSAIPPWLREEAPIITFSESDGERSLAWMDTFIRQTADLLQANQRILVGDEIISSDQGEEIRVRVLSFGLAGAYYSSPGAGTSGWYSWNGTRWTRESAKEYRTPIQNALAQVEGVREPDLVLLPVKIHKGDTP